MSQDFLCILSGGLDSTVNLYKAILEKKWTPKLAITFNYGQKAALKEIEASAKTCSQLNIKHLILQLPWFRDFNSSSSLTSSETVPHPTHASLDNYEDSLETAKAVWVPNRNGLFLNIAACYAEAQNIPIILTGFNKEEAATFPDNSEEFVEAINHTFSYSTQNHVKVLSLTNNLNKKEIAAEAKKLNVPLENLWFCYEGSEKPCGLCESCKRDFRALESFK